MPRFFRCPPLSAGRGAILRRAAVILAAALPCLTGCRQDPNKDVDVAPGIVFRRDPIASVELLDVDLQTANVRPAIVAKNVERIRNNFVADAKSVPQWAEEYGAIGGMNAGFFGDTYDQLGHRKQIVGLAIVDGKVVAPGSLVSSKRNPGERFLRSVVGFTRDGEPEITWATGTVKGTIRRYDSPVNPDSGLAWSPQSAVACGPHLFKNGLHNITKQEERLHSPGRLNRAFIAYDIENGKPRHFVMGRADAMEFEDIATYLSAYFDRVHHTRPEEGMCLDGGPSAQLVYRKDGRLEDAEPTGVLVPTALLLLPKR
jgi:hypothetical protein